MKKDKYKNLIFAYTVLYTFVTVLNSILYLYNGIYEDPSGNWHEIDRAIIVLIGVVAYALVTELIIKPMQFRTYRQFCLHFFMYGLRALEKI